MAGPDVKDTTCVDRPVPDYEKSVGASIKGMRIGIPKEYRVPGMAAEIEALWQRGIDWISVSSGGISPLQKIQPAPGYQVPFAEAIRKATGLKTIAVGLIDDPQQAETIVAGGQSDFVALARGMLYDPRWPWHAAAQLGATIAAPPSYWRATPPQHSGLFQRVKFGTR